MTTSCEAREADMALTSTCQDGACSITSTSVLALILKKCCFAAPAQVSSCARKSPIRGAPEGLLTEELRTRSGIVPDRGF
jgi:hypothetical protein